MKKPQQAPVLLDDFPEESQDRKDVKSQDSKIVTSQSNKVPKSYSLDQDNVTWLVTQAALRTVETGKKHTPSSLLNEMLYEKRGLKRD